MLFNKGCRSFGPSFLFSFSVMGILFISSVSAAEAGTCFQGTVSPAIANASVYLSCSSSGGSYDYASAWGQTDSRGNYTLDCSEYSYSPCGSQYQSKTESGGWSSCQIYAYQYSDSSVANQTEYIDVTPSCSTTQTQNLTFTSLDKTIAMTVQQGSTTITEGIEVYCYQNTSPYTYSSTKSSTNGVYNVSVTAGTFDCYSYCDWTYWSGSDCPYSGTSPRTTVTVGESDTTVSATLSYVVYDKTIRASITAGGTLISSGVQVYCSQQEDPWHSVSTSTASSDGTYQLSVGEGTYYCYAYCSSSSCDYSGSPSAYVTLGSSDSMVDISLAFSVRDKTIHVTAPGGMSIQASQQGGSWDYVSTQTQTNGVYSLSVGTGTWEVSGYCLDYQNCDYSGYPRATVKFEESDTEADVTLTFLLNNATLSGVVTDGSNAIANAYVSIDGYQVTGSGSGSALSSAVSSRVVKAAALTVTEEAADSSTQVYASDQTDSSGAFTVKVPAGSYKVCVYHPYDRNDLTDTCKEVTAVANTTTTMSLVMAQKTAEINGYVTDANGNAVVGAYVNGWSYHNSTTTGDSCWTQTDSNGYYTCPVVEGDTYEFSVDVNTWDNPSSTLCRYSNEGVQVVTATRTAQTVNFTIPSCNCTLIVNAVDSDGDIVSSVSGGIDATPSSFDTDEYYYGIWGDLRNGTGTLSVVEDREYSINVWLWDSDYTVGGEVTGTCSDGKGSVNISLESVIEDAVCGEYIDGEGNAVTISNIGYISVYAMKGRNYVNCTATSSRFCCDLSEGRWVLGYWIDPGSGYASGSDDRANSVTITSSGGVTQDLTLLNTGSIQATVLDLDGSGRRDVSVQCNPYSSAQEGANSYQYAYGSNWCYTNSRGECTMNVGAASGEGTVYYCNAYVSYSMRRDESLNNPQECEVTVIAGETAECLLQYEQPDGTAVITVTEGEVSGSLHYKGKALTVDPDDLPQLKRPITTEAASSPVVDATVDCFSSAGGSFQVTTDENGEATCPCTTDDTWYAVVSNMVGNALYLSETTQIPCSTDGAEQNVIEIDLVTTVPEGASKTVTDAATQSLTLELSDGFSAFFAPGCLGGEEETATCNVDPVVTPYTSNKMPASFYAYALDCTDSDGVAITQLNCDAIINICINSSQLTNMGLGIHDVGCSYFDQASGAYTDIPEATVDTETHCFAFTQSHLTDYAVIGNGFLGGIQGEDGGKVGTEDDGKGGSGTPSVSGGGGCGCAVVEASSNAFNVSIVLLFLLYFGVLRSLWRRERKIRMEK